MSDYQRVLTVHCGLSISFYKLTVGEPHPCITTNSRVVNIPEDRLLPFAKHET